MNILTTDFHTHILPGIDDGSQSVDESLEMLRKEMSDGVDTIVLTPHFYPARMYPETFLENRAAALKQLLNSLPTEEEFPTLIPGAEVLFSRGMSQWEQLDLLTIGDSAYILIEMPFSKWSETTYSELYKIRYERGLIPVLAHIERYLTRFNMNRILKRLSDIPVLLQMNCDYIIDKRTQGYALRLIGDKRIHLIGSDCHSSTWRSPMIAQANEILLANTNDDVQSFLTGMQNMIANK